MLTEATKVINSAFKDSFIKKLAMYLHDCVSEEVRSSSFRNLHQDNGNKWILLNQPEYLLYNPDKPLKIQEDQSKVTELMVQAEVSKKDYQLLYGYLFLKGKSSKNSRKAGDYLAPLLYAPCKLERKGMDINCTLLDENLSLNTSALVSLMDFDEEDDTAEHLFEGLIDYIPDLPITEEKIKIFLNTLKAILPEIDISQAFEESEADKKIKKQELLNAQLESLFVIDTSAIVMTKRPTVSAGLLHELNQISEKPSGVFRETALAPVQEEFSGAVKNKKLEKKSAKEETLTITPLDISNSQKAVIEELKHNTLVTVFGPPGTGKSQTIANIASHLIGSGQTVLVASRMDKAVDVISERLNKFEANFLCLRAGKTNYQKQLSNRLQDLISNKVDLDTGFESCVLSDIEDLKEHRKTGNDLKEKVTKILELETQWYQILKEYKEIWELQKDDELIKKALSKNEINYCSNLLDKIEEIYDKTGAINYLHLKTLKFILDKKLGFKTEGVSAGVIQKLRNNLQEKDLKESLKKTENLITKTGNLHQIFENLKELKDKYKTTAVKILQNKRRESLKSLIRDQYKRQRLIIHSKALVERKRNLQNKILLSEDFKPLLEAFPCWAVTTQSASESLPLEQGMFDVAIIDEASQCDIASCFPVLFRAKKAIIVGDDRQLPHLSFLEKAKEQSFLGKYSIPDKYHLMWRFRSNSMFDVANYYSTSSVLLDEHFRSCSDIINFSNREFYGNRIKVLKKELPDKECKSCVELHIVPDAKVDPDQTRNMAETEKIMEKLHEIIEKDSEAEPDKPVSIGIISPFRGQVELIKKAIAQVFPGEKVRKHQIEVGTAHTFQGDERDIILLSFTLAPNSHHQSIYFAQNPNLFNVAITRARQQLICYISRPIGSLPNGLLKNYLEYINSISCKDRYFEGKKFKEPVKKEIASLLEEEGFEVFNNFETGGYKTDFLVTNDEKAILIELDGFDHKNEDFQYKLEKHEVLQRCGWNIARLTAREWHYSNKAVINKIKGLLD